MSCSLSRRPSLTVSSRPASVIITSNFSHQNLKKSYTLRPYSFIDTSNPSTSNCTKSLDIDLAKKLILNQTLSQPINPAQNSFKNCEISFKVDDNLQSTHVLNLSSLSPNDIISTVSEKKSQFQNKIKCKNTKDLNKTSSFKISELGLYDEILSAIKDNKTLYSVYQNKIDSSFENNEEKQSFFETNEIQIQPVVVNIRSCDHCNDSSCQYLKRCKSITLSDYPKCLVKSSSIQDLKFSHSISQLQNNNDRIRTEYEVAIESLSAFATKIRRLSLENCLVISPSQGTPLPHHSRRHSTIPEYQEKSSVSTTSVLNIQTPLSLDRPSYFPTSVSETV